MNNKLVCPFCGEELRFAATDVVWYCRKHGFLSGNEKLWQALIQAKQDLEIARKALDIANKAIECSERFLLGVQDKKIEMAKATRSSHLLLFQMPAMAALCLNTVRDYKDQIKTITEHKE